MKTYNEKGRSMVEMIGVLTIIGVISAGGLVGYSKAMYKFQMSKTISMMTDALQDYALFLKRGMENYPDIDTPTEVREYALMNACEQSEYDSAACKMPLGRFYPRFGVLEGTDLEGADVLTYQYNLKLSFDKSQKNSCIDFLVYDWNHMVPDRWWHHGGYIKVTANEDDSGGQIVYSSSVNKLNPAGATDVCSTVCPEGTSVCNVIFHFRGEKY